SFSWSSDLIKHCKIHTGGQCCECGERGKSFRQSSNLIPHQTIHTRERPYILCMECGKSINCNSHLIRH
ncbi:ZN397 protein, partial [Rhabdornis inornatus]|nr:ZN397 protein [Rhabdornis inornatus]